ncbi:MAG TPA: nucleotidyltransferase family protein [Thermoanaerobaculia bacterium]|nr:nucleotidyltransferase family protein [Thermoanaerobaculia bacterium]
MSEVKLSPQISGELLSRLLHMEDDRATASELGNLSSTEWEDLLQQAERHQVTPLLHRSLQGAERRATVPAAVQERLEISYFQTAARSARIYAQLREMLEALGKEQIPVIVLKGAYLAEIAYADVTLRPMRDVDLLARQADLARAVRIAGVETLALGPEDLLLHLCLHTAFQHRFRVALRQIYDIAVVIQHHGKDLDWQALAEAARASGLGKVCYYTLAVTDSLFGAGAPAETLAALKEPGCEEGMVAVIRDYILLLGSQQVPIGLTEMLRQGGSGGRMGRLGLLLRSVFPPPDRLREIYSLPPGSKAVYGYYFVRLWDLFARRGRFVSQLVLPGSEARFAMETEAKALIIQRQLGVPPMRPGKARGR